MMSRTEQQQVDRLIIAYLNNGGRITVCDPAPYQETDQPAPSPPFKKGRKTKKLRTQQSNQGGRGWFWWHNGTERRRAKECPGDGWMRGTGLPRKSSVLVK